jgi:hypothetical protein
MADASAVVAIRKVVMTTFQVNKRSYSKTVWKDFTERRCRRGELWVMLRSSVCRWKARSGVTKSNSMALRSRPSSRFGTLPSG